MVQSAGPVSNNGPPSTKIKEVEWKNEAMVAAVFDGAEVCRECVAYFCVLRQLLFFFCLLSYLFPSKYPGSGKASRQKIERRPGGVADGTIQTLSRKSCATASPTKITRVPRMPPKLLHIFSEKFSAFYTPFSFPQPLFCLASRTLAIFPCFFLSLAGLLHFLHL